MLIPPVPLAVRRHLAENTHPGLLLDKFVKSWDDRGAAVDFSGTVQKPAVEDVVKLSQRAPDGLDWEEMKKRRGVLLDTVGAIRSPCVTSGPLTLHLARASALENAGICLHRVYGFAYLPGSGLKGLARSYAEAVAKASPTDVEAVFGTTEGSGQIVFHDAWPSEWPRLVADIVNNHHKDYYAAKAGDNAHPAGDWEEPNMVSFLAVPAGVTFDFPVSKRRADMADRLLNLAREWLLGGLVHLGAGAKTAAGYGTFRPVNNTPAAPAPANRAIFEATLELVTPAFLAGPHHDRAEGCDLRPATLRGLLRWWWRAMHVGYVDTALLRRLEATVWGDTTTGGAVRVEVCPAGEIKPLLYDKHAEAKRNHLPRTPDRKTTQGLWYHSYGMHDAAKQRHYLPPGTKWKLTLRARDGQFALTDRAGKPLAGSARRVDRAILLDQARVALWWLCMIGGIGSKGRKGFGNLREPPELQGFEGGRFVSKGKELREACGLPEDGFKVERAGGPALRQMVDLGRQVQEGSGWVQLALPTDNVWQALDAVGMAAQQFAQRYKHPRKKSALGLPRRIGHPARGQFNPGPDVKNRHASPIHYHLHPEGSEYVLRVAAFPAARLPHLVESEELLRELLRHFVSLFSSGG